MYGGYRGAGKSEDNSNPSVPSSAPTNSNRLRGLRSLSGLTQPVRTKHLLDELREVYDDIDNSASKRPSNVPEDDPLISWDKHSLPKGLEWMKPTPCKSKLPSANTIPETAGNFHSRNINHHKADSLASVGPTDKLNTLSDDLKVLESHVEVPTRPAVLNEFDKENVFVPLKTKSDLQLPNDHDFLSGTKKDLCTEVRSEGEPYLNHDLIHKAVSKEDLFTPLKRVKVDSTPATARLMNFHKTPLIPEKASSAQNSSPPKRLHNVPSGRKSPLNMQPHLSLLTPLTSVRPPSSVFSVSKKSAFSSLSVPLEDQHVSKPSNLDSWMTPAKGYSQVGMHHQELKSGRSYSKLSHAVPLTEKSEEKSEENDWYPSDGFSLKPAASKGPEEISQPEEHHQPSKIPSLSRNVQPTALNSCLFTPNSLVTPTPASTVKSCPKSTAEMPPPEIRKHPVKSSPESASHSANQLISSTPVGKKGINEEIFVNGKSYTVSHVLGRGGSSVVYEVSDPLTSNQMAIKCVNLSGLDQSTYEGYLNEIKLLTQLQDSDRVIRMYDHQHCKEEKLLYVVMEKGDTDLSKLIREITRTNKISPVMAVYFWTEMLNCVSIIHKRGTIHSDLKPANFLIVAGRLKLIDFGIASSIQADMTSVVKDSMTGTYNYISPEALCCTGSGSDGRRFKISYKSDVWSLGCILYNLVYGHTPFQTISHHFSKMKAIADPKHKISFPPAPEYPPALIQAMQACLVRDMKLRPSVDELLQYPYLGSSQKSGLSGFLEQINRANSTQPPSDEIQSVLSPSSKRLLEQINCVADSTQSLRDKTLSIKSLLSAFQSSNK